MRGLLNRYAGVRFFAVDLLCAGYAAGVAALLLVCHRSVPSWPLHATVHAAFAVVIVEGIRAAARHPGSQALNVARVFYPLALFAYAYIALDAIQPAIAGTYTMSGTLAGADVAIFGVHPTVWVERFYGTALDELCAFFYLSYYVIPLAITVPWYVAGDRRRVLSAAALVALTYTINFALFFALPALGPHHMADLAAAHHGHYQGLVFGPLCRAIQGDGGSIRGGVFPSAHVSASTAWALIAWRAHRKSGAVVAVLAAGIAVATVYLGFHHAVDAVAGIALGSACVVLGRWWLGRRGEAGA